MSSKDCVFGDNPLNGSDLLRDSVLFRRLVRDFNSFTAQCLAGNSNYKAVNPYQ